MIEERPGLDRYLRLPIRLLHAWRQQRRLEEGSALVEDARVAGRAQIFRRDVREPEPIVRTTRAQAVSVRLMPPMLHVAFEELSSGGSQQVCAREIGPREQHRHDVLQLIAEAEGAARLVVPASRPETAAHVLIEQPPIDQDVEGI